ncbi:MAG TPA: FCD domain-containing protein [Rectinema sp.]|jgi:GntR family transcriptional repressor for pyruvate dehydrogenase complex|nr:FCD domain-containing protein [Spirochaetota bacterium]NLH89257.1 FadR family transcriptional regulator [Treponema sp.]OQC74735.1 MAG: HTH-type transcriptional regulator LutR [Spirochaetes bacterium ADurb.Bin001]HNT59519.1 FCD domain-containing protein [Rectinema sp.]HNV35642.1 FCD domain-containing protein [Rectinema sp.]
MNHSKEQQVSDTLEGELMVFRYIREQIIFGNLKAGDKLPSERALSQMLKVSRGYVRKALSRLDHYGLIRTLPQRGTIVAELGSKAISGLIASIASFQDAFSPIDLFDIRELLEIYAARRAAVEATPEDTEEIFRWHMEFKAKADNGKRALEEDHLLHIAIAKASKNAVCLSLTSYITPQIIALNEKFPESDPDRFINTYREHDRIVKAIVAKDGVGAEDAMRNHMYAARQRRFVEARIVLT